MIPLRSGGASTAMQGVSSGSNGLMGFGDASSSAQASQLLAMTQGNACAHQKKSVSKQRAGGAATSQGMASQGLSFIGNNNSGGSTAGFGSNSAHRGSEGVPNMSILMHPHNQTVKIPQQYLSNNIHKVSGIPNMTAALSAAGVQAPSSLSMNSGVVTINGSSSVSGAGANGDKNLSASQKKRISLKKLEEEYCKTIEQIGSPNSSTLNLENMKKTHSLHYMRAGSGASSPQQIKSRTSIGKYGQNQPPGMAIYNNYNNHVISTSNNNSNGLGQIQQRNSFVSKSQIGQVLGSNVGNGTGMIPGHHMGMQFQQPGSALGTGNRSRSKTTNRKKRNLYTSMGNYYQSQQPSANQNGQQTNNSASRVTKRVHQQNFLDNLEQTNMLIGGNLAAAHQMLVQEEILTKKRNKSSTKSYNNKELLDHNNSSEIAYNSNLTKKNPLTNNFFDVSQFSSNHNSIAKNFENSFQFSAGGFLQPTHHSGKTAPGQTTSGTVSLSAVSANKQRPTSSHKSALMQATSVVNGVLGGVGGSSSAKPQKKKAQGASSGLRKSVNNVPTTYNSSNLMNSSANYGQLQQNAYDFLSNASLFLNSSKAARRPKGGNSAIDSRCSQNKDHIGALGLVKSQVASNTAFGHQQLNNTSHTTICSNRKGPNQGEIVSGKKNSLQQQIIQQNYMSLAGNGQNDMLTAGEISSDRQTLKMNDFLKQIEAYSNDKLDKFMPQMMNGGNGNQQQQQNNAGSLNANQVALISLTQQAKIAEQVKAIIEREMTSTMAVMRTNSSKQRYQNDESRGGESNNEVDEEDGAAPQLDYEHLLNVISESFNSLIGTFYQNTQTAIVGASLGRIKESYEEIINSIVENLSQQIEQLQAECDQVNEENSLLKDRNSVLEQFAQNQEQNTKQVTSFVRQNEALNDEVFRLKEENKALKRDQKDKDYKLGESIKIIEKLSASQKQLMTQTNHNSSGSSKVGANRYQNESQVQQSQKNINKLSAASVPPLDLGRVKMVWNQQVNQQMPMLSNDSVQTLDKALLNANLQDPSQSSVMNTVPHHEGSRMLEELYSNHNHQPGQPFDVNQSDISYVNSEENDGQGEDGPSSYLNSGGNHHPGVGVTQSGRQSSIAQDKSPIMKPFIPPLNLNGLNNRQQAALQGKSQQQISNHSIQQQPQQIQAPVQQPQPIPAQKPMGGMRPNFKLDLTGMPPPGVLVQEPQQPILKGANAVMLDQDNSSAEPMVQAQKGPPKIGGLGLGLNLANLKQQKGIVDFQDEFNAKYDEYSESWRNAMNREKRF